MIYFQEPSQIKGELNANQQRPKLIRESPSFASQSSRFVKSNSDILTPGPGQYNIPSKDIQRTSKYKVNKNCYDQFQRQDSWLFQNKRFSNQNANKSRHLGPGTYSPTNIQAPKPVKFSFPKNLRFNNNNSPTSPILGPGSYNIDLKKIDNKNMLSSFKSNSQRFNSPSNIQDTEKNNVKVKIRFANHQSQLEKKVKQDKQMLRKIQTEEQQKNKLKKQKSKDKIMPFFKSKIPRFQPFKTQKIGPGYYETLDLTAINKNQDPTKQHIKPYFKNRIKKTYLQAKQENPQIIVQKPLLQNLRGPNLYNPNNYTIEHQIQKGKKGAYIDQQTRFNFHKKSKSISMIQPGPGYYQQNKYSYINKDQYLRKNFDFKSRNMDPTVSVPFLTGQQRPINKKQTDKHMLDYSNDYYDIKTKKNRDTMQIAKLKIMNANIPAFNSNSKRFLE